jgi:nitric oxide reductase subunit B
MAIQKWRGDVYMGANLVGAWKWKWAIFLLHAGMIIMVMALLISGYEQSQIERAIGGSSWVAYFAAQEHRWFVQGMFWRQIGGWMFAGGFVLLAWDLMTIGKNEKRPTDVIPAETLTA